jgi:hypothetical protein
VSEEKDKMAAQYGLRATNSGLRIFQVFNLTFASEHSSSAPSSNQPGEGDASLRDHALIEADQEMPCAESQPRTAFPPTLSFIRQTSLRCVPRGIEAPTSATAPHWKTQNFREKFEALNRSTSPMVSSPACWTRSSPPMSSAAAQALRERNAFTRDDGTPLNYTLVNIKDWCKNTFEVVNQLRINTDNSHHRYDVLILLINGVPCVQIELKTLGINPRRAMEQIVDYKNDPGNGYTKTLLCFLQLFIVSNRDRTPGTSPTTTPVTSPSTPRSASCPSTSLPTRTTRRSPTSTSSPRPSS